MKKKKSSLFEANYEKGVEYLWVPAATLAMFCIGAVTLERGDGKPSFIPCFTSKPDNGHDYHRCEINVVRTKKECATLKAKWDKKRKEYEKTKAAFRPHRGIRGH